MQLIQMQLTKKQKTFSQYFSAVLEFRLNFKDFETKDTLIAYMFQKSETLKDVVRQMSKKSRFRRAFNKQHGKRYQTLFKSA